MSSVESWSLNKTNNELKIPEKRELFHAYNVMQKNDLLNHYSSWSRLLRITAYIFCFINAMRKKRTQSQFLTAKDISFASEFLIKYIHEREFSDEIQCISIGNKLKSNSQLRKLDPFLDNSQILRLGWRIKNAKSRTSSQKCPAIIPKHPLANLIVSQVHANLLHAGTQLTLGVLKEKFWILGARSIVKSVIYNCVICFRYNSQNQTQFMTDLPSFRCSPSRVFSHTGVDYAGPLFVWTGSGGGIKSHKAYIALFICLSTRAVHLELVNSMRKCSF